MMTPEEREALIEALPEYAITKAHVENAMPDLEKVVALIVDRVTRQAAARALREAAGSWQTGGWADDLPPAGASRVQLILGMSQRACNWLRDRAARIERGEL